MKTFLMPRRSCWIVNLHQEDYWLPDENKPNGFGYKMYLWLHIAAGWLFTTLAALSLSGIIRKE
jgi:hypothetical protein